MDDSVIVINPNETPLKTKDKSFTKKYKHETKNLSPNETQSQQEDVIEVICFEDYLKVNSGTKRSDNTKRKRLSDAESAQKKKQKVSVEENAVNNLFVIKDAHKKTTQIRNSKFKNKKKITNSSSDIVDLTCKIDQAKFKNKNKRVVKAVDNRTKECSNNTNAGRKSGSAGCKRSKSSDGISDVQILKEATNPEKISVICRTPVKAKKKLLQQIPLKNGKTQCKNCNIKPASIFTIYLLLIVLSIYLSIAKC